MEVKDVSFAEFSISLRQKHVAFMILHEDGTTHDNINFPWLEEEHLVLFEEFQMQNVHEFSLAGDGESGEEGERAQIGENLTFMFVYPFGVLVVTYEFLSFLIGV